MNMTSNNEDKKDKQKRRKDPIDIFGFNNRFFKNFFDDDLMDDFQRMAEEMFRMLSNAQPGRSFVHGYSVHVGPDGKPHFEEFGNHRVKSSNGKSGISEDREPITDIIEGKKDVSVTVEIPGVEKEDIDLRVTERDLEITVDTPHRKYHKNIYLPAEVKPQTTKATYKNGILDVVIQRKCLYKDEEKGFKVDIN